MKQILVFLAKLVLFLELFFVFGRIFFLSYNYDKINTNSIYEIFISNIHSLPLDFSAIGYFLAVTFLLIIIGNWINQKAIKKIIYIFLIAIIIICSFLNIVDTALVSTWGTRINSKALSYLFYPKLMRQSFLAVNYFVLLTWLFSFTSISIILFNKLIGKINDYKVANKSIYLFLPLLLLIFTFIRGGLGNNPIGKSRGVYSDNPTLNMSTINGFWNFLSISIKKKKADTYNYFSLNEAEEMVQSFKNPEKDTTELILTQTRPNIVVILLESFSGENMKCLGGKENIAPCLDSLSQKGLLFNNFYATGSRTEQGFVALLSGFPAQPKFSIQRESGKVFKLPMLGKILKKNNYELNFYYTGDLSYARTDEYLKIGLFDHLYGDKDFKNVDHNNSGAYDEYLFDFQLRNSTKCKTPFFSLMLTSSTHEPFDGHFNKVFKGNKVADNYKNAAHYSDSCLAEYLKKVKKQIWYPNTLFIILADHANPNPNNRDYNEPLRFKIPMLFFGDVLKKEFNGKVYEAPASQIDIPNTLLHQLKIESSVFEFSKNLFNPHCKNFAFYTFDDGFGVIDKENTMIFDNDKNAVLQKHSSKTGGDKTLEKGKSFLQILMQRFKEME